MKLEHANRTAIATHHQLDDIGKAQLRVCGLRWDGQDLPAERRLFVLFRANSDEVVASIIQSRAQPERGDSALREPLQELLRAMGFA